jgi:GR25 family glycosyltransferase involved in LPS biosynthesis
MNYKAYVITIEGLKQSEAAAERCIASAQRQGLEVYKHYGITPKDDPEAIMAVEGIPADGFREVYSYLESCLSAFLSHYSLWKKCVQDNCQYIIFEHDAILVDVLDFFAPFDKCMNIGAPSYGKYVTPSHLGVGPLTSKQYFPGAHAYRLKPAGAKLLIEQAKQFAMPTDVFLHTDRFPWLQEQYPWPAKARDTFTTIQREQGCIAKHNWKDGIGYEIIR